MRKFLQFAIPFFCCGGLLISTGAYSKSVDVFNSQNWKGVARYDGETGQFSRCTAEAVYKSNIYLNFGIDSFGKMEVWLYHKQWKLETGQIYPIELKIDRYRPHHGSLDVKAATLGVVTVKQTTTFFDQVRRGSELVIRGQGNPLYFSLAGTSGALKELKKCWLQRSAERLSTNPFSSGKSKSTSNPFSSRKSEDKISSATKLGRVVLSRLTDKGFSITNDPSSELKSMKAQLYWSAPNTFGMAHYVSINFKLKTLEKILGAEDKKSCIGEFAVASKIRPLGDNKIANTVQTACTENSAGVPAYVTYTFYPMKPVGHLRISHIGVAPEDVLNADLAFIEVVKGFVLKASHAESN